jgi:hypothetical protein
MKIAIVGRSKLTGGETDIVHMIVETIVERSRVNGDTIITGDADGVDECVQRITNSGTRISMTVYKSLTKTWNGKHGFKERNIQIAKSADYVYSITTKTKNEKCYHCDLDHQRTGGCYTLKMARKFGKQGEVIVI